MIFSESPSFPRAIAFGATGGPEYQTGIVIVNSGYESRNVNWANSRGKWDVGLRPMSKADTDTIVAFFRAMKGRAYGFRFRDWSDYLVAQPEGVLTKISNGVYQLAKYYASGGLNETRNIVKPVTATPYRNGVASTAGSGAGQYALNTTTGIVTFVPDITASISAITKANPGVVTTVAAHGLASGQTVELSAIGGMTQLSGANVVVTVLTATTFSIGIDTTAYAIYTSGGLVKKFIQSSEVLSWSGEFDVPVRFDTDHMQLDVIDKNDGGLLIQWGQIPIIEIRA